MDCRFKSAWVSCPSLSVKVGERIDPSNLQGLWRCPVLSGGLSFRKDP